MKSRLIAVFVAIAVLAVGGVSYAATAAPADETQVARPAELRRMMLGGMDLKTIAQKAGMSVDELITARRAGTSFRSILASKNVDINVLVAELQAAAKTQIDKDYWDQGGREKSPIGYIKKSQHDN